MKVMSQMQADILLKGSGQATDMELISIILGAPGIARALLECEFDWRDMSRSEMVNIPYFGSQKIAQVIALRELSRRIDRKAAQCK